MNTLSPLIFIVTLSAVVLTSCDRVKPKPPEATGIDTLLQAPLSTVTLPVQYRVSDLQGFINTKIKDTFIKKWIVINEKQDSLYLEVARQKNIIIKRKERTLFFTIPLKISGKFRTQVAGIKIRNSEPVEAEIVLHLETRLHLDSKWNLIPETTIKKIDWIKEPTIKVVFVNVGLRKPIEKILNENEEHIVKKADDGIQQMLNTRKVVQKLWTDIQKPIRINKKEASVWLKAYGKNLTGYLEDTESDLISLLFELRADVKTIIEGDSIPSSNPVLPDYKQKTSGHDSLEIYVHSQLPFDKMNEILNNTLRNAPLTASGYSTEIKDIKVYGTDSGLAIAVKVKGDVTGKIYLQGTPTYDSLSTTFGVRDFKFDVDSESALISSADWLLHTTVVEMISEKLVIDMQEYIDILPRLIMQAIDRGKAGEKIDVNIGALRLVPLQIITTKNDIQVITRATGKATLELKDEVFTKKK